LNDRCSAEDQVRQSSVDRAETEDGIASVWTQETARICTPHPHDAAFGRRDANYYHTWNVQFRVWVSERETSYRLACSDGRKRIIRAVFARKQNPPGCFLQRDSTPARLWIEADDPYIATRLARWKEGVPRSEILAKRSIKTQHCSLHPSIYTL
jgi:hypothetical protein